MYAHILIAVDDSATSNRALQEAIRLAQDQHAALRIVYVADTLALQGAAPLADAAESEQAWREIGDVILERARAVAAGAGVSAETALLETEDVEDRVAQAITGEARRWGADLLIAGTHGRGGLKHMIMGSVAEGIVRHAPVPVMLVRGQ